VSTWQTVATLAEIPAGKVAVYTVGDHTVALANAEGAYFAIDDLCTHDGGPLGEGELEGSEIECPATAPASTSARRCHPVAGLRASRDPRCTRRR
jgi:3-phenylpropionate/trans-cinnamate dioxygenase ferredoxin subunit